MLNPNSLKAKPADNYDDLKKQLESRRKEVNNKMVKDKDWGEKEHSGMWEGIKSKVPNHLFYLFVSVFSVLYIIGIVAVYTGMHKIDKSLSTQISGVKTDVKVMSTALQYLDKKVDDHIVEFKQENGRK